MYKCLLILIFCLMNLGSVQAAPNPQPANPLADSLLSWTMYPWSGDDTPYKTIRYAVFDAMQKSQNPLALVRQYKAAAQKKPLDQHVVFRYAYATYQLTTQDKAFKQTTELHAANWAAQHIDPPRTYQFARLLFLMETTLGGYGRALLPLSERLLQRDPNDVQVMYRSLDILNGGMFPQDTDKAIAYAQKMVHLLPRSASVYAALGSVYFDIWGRTKSKSDADQAIAGYQKFLALAPANDPFRPRAEYMIRWLQQGHMPHK